MRNTFKTLISYVAIACVSPLGISERLARHLLKRDVWFEWHADFLSLVPGKFGRYLRNAYYWMTLKQCPLDCCFVFGMSFTHSDATVGHRAYIGAYSRLGIASIGDDTLFGDHVQVLSGREQHTFRDPHLLIREQPQIFRRIHIGSNCWIGTRSVIMADIGQNCVIGAGSVVTQPISDGHIAAGNPARILRAVHRTHSPDVVLEKLAERRQSPYRMQPPSDLDFS
jgi:virginiamycin A acetyltransferase